MEALGLIDAIISTISDSPRPMLSKGKVTINESQILDMLEKLRLVVQKGGSVARESVAVDNDIPAKKKSLGETNPQLFGLEGEALLRQAKEESDKIRESADKYAENVLTNLQVVISKMMRNIETGKSRLAKYQEES